GSKHKLQACSPMRSIVLPAHTTLIAAIRMRPASRISGLRPARQAVERSAILIAGDRKLEGSEQAQKHQPPRPSRNACGVMPVCLRKNRVKCEGSEKARS